MSTTSPPTAAPTSTITPSPSTTSLPKTYPHKIPISIIGGTGLSTLPSPPFTPLAVLPPAPTPWGTPSSPITILSYQPPSSTTTSTTPSPGPKQTIVVAFLARHGPHHSLTPSEIPNRANIGALKKLGVRCAIGFSAVGSLRSEVKPRDFVVAGGVVDWTKGIRPCTFFEDGVVGHVGMARPFDRELSELVYSALAGGGGGGEGDQKVEGVGVGVLQGRDVEVHREGVVVCIEGPQFSTRSESQLYRSLAVEPPVNCVNMSAVPECKLFKEAEIAYSLVCMSTDYDSWKGGGEEGVSVEMVMGHMVANGENAKRAVGAILEALGREEEEAGGGVMGERLRGTNRGAVMGLGKGGDARGAEAVERLTWLFGEDWVGGKV